MMMMMSDKMALRQQSSRLRCSLPNLTALVPSSTMMMIPFLILLLTTTSVTITTGYSYPNNIPTRQPIHRYTSPLLSSSLPSYRVTSLSHSLLPHDGGCSCGCHAVDTPEETSPPLHNDVQNRKQLLSSRKARIRIPFDSTLFLLSTVIGGATPSFASTTTTTTPPPPKAAASVEDFNSSLGSYFPGSIANDDIVLKRLVPALKKRGFTRGNTLLGSSLCSDEINDSASSRSLLRTIDGAFGAGNGRLDGKILPATPTGIFSLGGLGGVPAVGTTGFGAFFSHCPTDDGKVLIVYGPHVGISDGGTVGKVERLGQLRRGSASCGAALGAYRALTSGKKTAPKKNGKEGGLLFDYQQEYIVKQLGKRIGKIQGIGSNGDTNAEIAALTQQMYDIIDEVMTAQIRASTTGKAGFFDTISEVVLVGGIVINRGYYDGGDGLGSKSDYFQPLSMKAMNVKGTVDLYNEVFS